MSTQQWLWSLRLAVVACLISFSASYAAASSAADSSEKDSATATYQINSDACIKCHRRNGQMLGHHGQDAMKMSCSTCHGEQGEHPKKPNNLKVFGEQAPTSVALQQDVCLKCHSPAKLGEREWTHNVHANKLSCAACHQLHSPTEPMANLSLKARSDVCRRCHTGKQE
ncbi:cytochrome c3 family protein [Shewanella sp. A25]|nr:cytochrome c3 family protein [Shewanella shenzhenensis]